MTDPELTPAQEESVRALLRGARHTEPTPEHVVARLDARLAELTAHRDDSPAATVVPLAARRRRRAASLLVAAAALVAGGVALPQLLPSGEFDAATDTGGTVAEGQADDSGEGHAEAGEDPHATSAEAAPRESPLSGGTQLRTNKDSGLPRLSSDGSLERQAAEALGSLPLGDTATDNAAGCVVPTTVPGRRVPVTYDGARAVMLVRDVSPGRQRVAVYLCGATLPVDSVTLTRP